ncbi:MAG: hypothetical protein PVI86_18545 [Phycisphaerae bacterium]|jgi:hypothetical protein
MNAQHERVERVAQLRKCLSKVVELGYGEDECDQAILLMFEDVVRHTVPERESKVLSFRLPLQLPKEKNDYAHLLRLTREVHHFAETWATQSENRPSRDTIVFPFLTTLGISGGVFMLAFHLARLVPSILGT